MQSTEEQYEHIVPLMRVQRGNVRISNLQAPDAIPYVAGHGCKWRGWPPRFGRRHTVHTQTNRRPKSGIPDRVSEHIRKEQLVRIGRK